MTGKKTELTTFNEGLKNMTYYLREVRFGYYLGMIIKKRSYIIYGR